MYRQTSRLLLYSDLGEDAILFSLADIFKDFRARTSDEASLIRRIYTQVKRILDLATTYGFDENLWQNSLTFLLVTNENSFTLTAERRGAGEGSVNHFAKNDFRIFRELFRFDFSEIENALGIDCFSTLTSYKAVSKAEKSYYRSVSEKVQALSKKLASAADEN